MPSTISPFPLDDLLRRHGWQIAARASGAEPLWHKGDVLLGQADALERLPSKDVREARKAHDQHTRAA